MDQKIETYYKSYQKNSDSNLIRAYFELEDKLELTTNSQDVLLELKDRAIALKKVINERELNLDKHIQIRSKSKKKEATMDGAFKEQIKEGSRAFFIGAIIFIISLIVLNFIEWKSIPLFGLLAGGLKMIQGFIILSVGLFVRVWYAK